MFKGFKELIREKVQQVRPVRIRPCTAQMTDGSEQA
jgi:hypothetical protein